MCTYSSQSLTRRTLAPSIDLRSISSVRSKTSRRRHLPLLPRSFVIATVDDRQLVLKASDGSLGVDWVDVLQIAVRQAKKETNGTVQT